jgi:hypothetical protein
LTSIFGQTADLVERLDGPREFIYTTWNRLIPGILSGQLTSVFDHQRI